MITTCKSVRLDQSTSLRSWPLSFFVKIDKLIRVPTTKPKNSNVYRQHPYSVAI